MCLKWALTNVSINMCYSHHHHHHLCCHHNSYHHYHLSMIHYVINYPPLYILYSSGAQQCRVLLLRFMTREAMIMTPLHRDGPQVHDTLTFHMFTAWAHINEWARFQCAPTVHQLSFRGRITDGVGAVLWHIVRNLLVSCSTDRSRGLHSRNIGEHLHTKTVL